LRALANLEAVNPGNAGNTSECPTANGCTINKNANWQKPMLGSQQNCDTPRQLQQGHHDEDAGQLWMLGMQADCATMNGASSD
jgi:hypothetical protein